MAVFSAAVDAGLGWLAVVMAANVVVALVYYLRWTALLFRPAADGAALPRAVPRTLTATVALAALIGVALSGAPQLILRFTATSLF